MTQQKIEVRVLVVSDDNPTVETLRHFMEHEAMKVRVCIDRTTAAHTIGNSKFEAVILDFAKKVEALELLKQSRQIALQKGVVVMAVLNGNDEVLSAFRAGASFVLVRPLSAVTLIRTLRASYPLMVRERKRYFRCPLQVPTYISIAARSELMATCANISEGGISIANAPALQVGERVALRLTLPGAKSATKITAKVCWRDDAGRAGMEFVWISPAVKEELSSWLGDRLAEFPPEGTVPNESLQLSH